MKDLFPKHDNAKMTVSTVDSNFTIAESDSPPAGVERLRLSSEL